MSLKVHSEARMICWKLSLRLQVFKTKFLTFIFRVSGSCKNVGTQLWYIEQEVRLSNNQTYTSRPQKWHVPSKKQQRLHGPAILNEIETKKPRHEKILQEKNNNTVCRSKFDPRAKVDRKTNAITGDLDILADATDGKCGIVLLIRKHNVRPNLDINEVKTKNILKHQNQFMIWWWV